MKKCKLILALDVPGKKEFIRWIDRTKDYVRYYKVGLEVFTRLGPESVKILKSKGKKVFLDLKFFDIPNTVISAVNSAASLGVDIIDLHLLNDLQSLIKIKSGINSVVRKYKKNIDILGITLLTSSAGGSKIKNKVLSLALSARDIGFSGVVCSGHEAELVRKKCGRDFIIACPGIRLVKTKDDQKRVSTPNQVKAYADYIIVGRPVLQAKRPLGVLENILAELER